MASNWRIRAFFGIIAALFLATILSDLRAACCYFSAKNLDVLQPAQKVFITWDPERQIESFTVQPKFEGNAQEFGMVIPTPAQPKLHEMPRDFFSHLAVYTIMMNREFPQSQLLWAAQGNFGGGIIGGLGGLGGGLGGIGGFVGGGAPPPLPPPPSVRVVETGLVGSLDYKIIEAHQANALFDWLRNHKYNYSGDEATLQHYIQKKWYFTVMKIDAMQMKKNKDGSFAGEVTPTRFQFQSEKLVYPLKITQVSVRDKTEALFYIQAPTKMDLEGDMSYQLTWTPMLQAARGCSTGKLPGKADDWLEAIKDHTPELVKRAEALDFRFVAGQRPSPNGKNVTPTTIDWARKLTLPDLQMLSGQRPYSEHVPNVDAGITMNDVRNPRTAPIAAKIIQTRLDYFQKQRPQGFLVRRAPASEIQKLSHLSGHLQEGQFITKFRKTFNRAEMNDDLTLVPAAVGRFADRSEYYEMLSVSPP